MSGIYGSNPPEPRREDGQGRQALGLQTSNPEPAPGPQQAGGEPTEQQPPRLEEFQQQQQQVEQQPEGPPPAQQGQPEGQEQQEGKILGKFRDYNELWKGIGGLADKLGYEVNKDAFQTEQDLVSAYKELEQQLGGTSDIDQTRQQLTKAQHENQLLKQRMQQIMSMYSPYKRPYMGMQYPPGQTPQQAPYQQIPQGYYPPQAQQPQQTQQPPQQQTQPEPPQQDYDPDKFIEKFYKEGPKAIDEYLQSRYPQLTQQQQQQMAQQMQQQMPQQPQQQPQQQMYPGMQQQQQYDPQEQLRQMQKAAELRQKFDEQIMRMQNQYGDEFNKYRDKVMEFISKPSNQYYLRMPDGLENVFKRVRREGQFQEKQQAAQQQQQIDSKYFKRAAQMPGPSSRQPYQPKSEEEMLKDSIFRQPKSGGIYG